MVSNLFCAFMSVSTPLSPPFPKYTRFAILIVTFVNREAGSTRISYLFAVDLEALNGVQSVTRVHRMAGYTNGLKMYIHRQKKRTHECVDLNVLR